MESGYQTFLIDQMIYGKQYGGRITSYVDLVPWSVEASCMNILVVDDEILAIQYL